ncbi:hypothetical protein CBR_g54084 [Chara braunii]|uniref:Reverse transcriptase domain-containing protein n=1 Tax=Chara braunii TaxID=69332 RepID=A0A388MC07_CHABU|nr:hypothetical protein CBR_g54084 [Chara braunii]|eukprot:GBG91989.1 hypothetical protein CBR_g54084 [Chara braunii]
MNVAPQGWMNAVSMVQRHMVRVMQPISPHITQPYIDDLVVKGPKEKDEQEVMPRIRRFVWDHVQDLCKVLDLLKEHNLTASGSKSRHCMSGATILGFVCDERGRRPDTKKINKILEWPTLFQTITEELPLQQEVRTKGGRYGIGWFPQEFRSYIWMFDFELERIPGSKNRADGLSRVDWDNNNQGVIEDTPPVDGFLDSEEDVSLHMNSWALALGNYVTPGRHVWLAPLGHARRPDLVLKPYIEEDCRGMSGVDWMMDLALAGKYELQEDLLMIESGALQEGKHEKVIGGMYLLANTPLKEEAVKNTVLDQEEVVEQEGGDNVIHEREDDDFEEGEIKEAFRAEEYEGVYLVLGMLLSCEMRERDACARVLKMRARQICAIEDKIEEAASRTTDSHIKDKFRWDKMARVRKEPLKVGDTVLLYDSSLEKQWSQKLDKRWLGPYRVTRCGEHGVDQIEELNGTTWKEWVSGSRLKKFVARDEMREGVRKREGGNQKQRKGGPLSMAHHQGLRGRTRERNTDPIGTRQQEGQVVQRGVMKEDFAAARASDQKVGDRLTRVVQKAYGQRVDWEREVEDLKKELERQGKELEAVKADIKKVWAENEAVRQINQTLNKITNALRAYLYAQQISYQAKEAEWEKKIQDLEAKCAQQAQTAGVDWTEVQKFEIREQPTEEAFQSQKEEEKADRQEDDEEVPLIDKDVLEPQGMLARKSAEDAEFEWRLPAGLTLGQEPAIPGEEPPAETMRMEVGLPTTQGEATGQQEGQESVGQTEVEAESRRDPKDYQESVMPQEMPLVADLRDALGSWATGFGPEERVDEQVAQTDDRAACPTSPEIPRQCQREVTSKVTTAPSCVPSQEGDKMDQKKVGRCFYCKKGRHLQEACPKSLEDEAKSLFTWDSPGVGKDRNGNLILKTRGGIRAQLYRQLQ